MRKKHRARRAVHAAGKQTVSAKKQLLLGIGWGMATEVGLLFASAGLLMIPALQEAREILVWMARGIACAVIALRLCSMGLVPVWLAELVVDGGCSLAAACLAGGGQLAQGLAQTGMLCLAQTVMVLFTVCSKKQRVTLLRTDAG